MVINESGLRAAMADAFRKKSTGYKVALRQLEGKEPEIVLSAQDWTVLLARKNAPRKVLALIVEHLGDLPRPEEAFHVKDGSVQTEIYNMAVPAQEKPNANVIIRRTKIAYMGYTVYQNENDGAVYMIPQKLESLLGSGLLPLSLANDGKLFTAGRASQVYIKPYVPMKGDVQALQDLAKHKWI